MRFSFIFGIGILFLTGVFIASFEYAKGHAERPEKTQTAAVKKKARPQKRCACCANKSPQQAEALQQIIEKKRKHQHALVLLKQHGVEEGFRLLKKEDPDIASELLLRVPQLQKTIGVGQP